MEALKKRKVKSTNTSPRDAAEKKDSSPRVKLIGRNISPEIVCPVCKTAGNVVSLGLWKENYATVYFCGTTYPDEKACRNVWMPEAPHIQIDEVLMRYLPAQDGVYLITFQ